MRFDNDVARWKKCVFLRRVLLFRRPIITVPQRRKRFDTSYLRLASPVLEARGPSAVPAVLERVTSTTRATHHREQHRM
jgi:hypothetical protein